MEKKISLNINWFSYLDDTAVYARNVGFDYDTYEQVCGIAYQPNPEDPGKLIVDFPFSPPGDYWILDTDYENYTVIYSCRKKGDSALIFSWVNTRSRNPSPEIVSVFFYYRERAFLINFLIGWKRNWCPPQE